MTTKPTDILTTNTIHRISDILTINVSAYIYKYLHHGARPMESFYNQYYVKLSVWHFVILSVSTIPPATLRRVIHGVVSLIYGLCLVAAVTLFVHGVLYFVPVMWTAERGEGGIPGQPKSWDSYIR